jgi:hypothetical protein
MKKKTLLLLFSVTVAENILYIPILKYLEEKEELL